MRESGRDALPSKQEFQKIPRSDRLDSARSRFTVLAGERGQAGGARPARRARDRKVLPCAGVSRPTRQRRNGAPPACPRSPLHREAAGARKSSRSLRGIFEIPVCLAARRGGFARMEGPDAVANHRRSARRFRGRRAWETEILPARVAGYEPDWLTISACRPGHLDAAQPAQPTVPNGARRSPTPCARRRFALLQRRHGRAMGLASARPEPASLSPRADMVAELIRSMALILRRNFGRQRPVAVPGRGRRLPSWLRWVSSTPTVWRPGRPARAVGTAKSRTDRPPPAPHAGFRHGRRRPLALVRPVTPQRADDEEHFARVLLNRYGVVLAPDRARGRTGCRRGAICCASFAVSSIGEIRGRPLRAGFSGEQFALPDAVGMLRETRRKPSLASSSRSPPPIRSTSQASSRRAQNSRVDRQPRALPRRPADRDARRRRGAIPGDARFSQRMGGAKKSCCARSRRPVAGACLTTCRRNPMLIANCQPPSGSDRVLVLVALIALRSIRIANQYERAVVFPPGKIQPDRGARALFRPADRRMAEKARPAHGDSGRRAAGKHHPRQRADQDQTR